MIMFQENQLPSSQSATHLHCSQSVSQSGHSINQSVSHHFQRWKDEHLTWNPEDFGGVSHIYVPHSQVWKPDIFIENALVLTKVK